MKTPGIYYGAIAAFCVISILVGFAGAADTAVPVKNGAGIHGFGHGQPPSMEAMIDHLEQQGVDVTEVKTALQNGDNEAVKTWLEAYREENRDQMRPASRMGNVTQGCGQNR